MGRLECLQGNDYIKVQEKGKQNSLCREDKAQIMFQSSILIFQQHFDLRVSAMLQISKKIHCFNNSTRHKSLGD